MHAGTEEEAAEAYDIAAIKFRGLNAVTNFDMNRYDVKSILESNTLPIGGGAAKRLKEAQAMESSRKRDEMLALTSTFQYGSSSSSSSRMQAYSGGLIQIQQEDQFQHQPPIPLLSLQNHELSDHYCAHQDPASSFHQNYIQTQLQLHQQSAAASSYSIPNHHHHNPQQQLYSSYNIHPSHPGLLQGLMDTNSSSGGGYIGNNGMGMCLNISSTSGNADQLPLVKVDYDMPPPSGGYGGWSGGGGEGGSVQGSSNAGVFSMWND